MCELFSNIEQSNWNIQINYWRITIFHNRLRNNFLTIENESSKKLSKALWLQIAEIKSHYWKLKVMVNIENSLNFLIYSVPYTIVILTQLFQWKSATIDAKYIHFPFPFFHIENWTRNYTVSIPV